MRLSNKFSINRKLILILVITIILGAIVINPEVYITSCLNGIMVWATVVLPALLPFMFFTKTLTELGVADILASKFKLFPKIFKVPSLAIYVFILSILSGYPVGAKIVADLYESGAISKEEAYKITTFTSNSGPMFILGSVGIGMLASRKLGIIILISHILGALINGLIYRNHKENSTEINKKIIEKNNLSIGDLMWNTVHSVLIIGGFIALFFVIIEIINNLNIFSPISNLFSKIFNCDANIFTAIFNGIFEITRGCLDISKLGLSELISGTLCTFIISFGGLATTMQALVFLKKFDMRFSFFIKQKITHAIFASVISFILLLIF